jgi:hypothetical protein
MMYCTQCKIEAKSTAKFCPRCGGRLVSEAIPENRTMQCPQCGKIYGPDHRFCANDGSQLESQRTLTGFPSKPLATTALAPILKIVLLVIALLFLAALGTGGYLYFSGRWMDIPILVKWFTPPSTQKSMANGTNDITRDSRVSAEIAKEDSLADSYCGIWEYDENGAKNYLKITKEKSGRFRFDEGYKYEGKICWMETMIENADGIYLKLTDGKLKGEFVSSNFRPTHGMEFLYKITLDFKSNNKLFYSIWSEIRGETDEYEAIRIGN